MAVSEVSVLLFTNYFVGIFASYHWKVTEHGRISSQVENSGFPLAEPDDLLAFLEQEQRLQSVNKLYKQLMALKKSIDKQWSSIEREGDVEKRLYATDMDCLLGVMPLGQQNLKTEFLDYNQGSRPKMKGELKINEPDCTIYSKLDFSMRIFPHLDTLNGRNQLNLSVNSVPSKTSLEVNIDAMLQKNKSDWTAYNLASHYWRTLGNGTNALECAKRALYFSPRKERHIVLLNLGTLLQDLDSLGEAAIVLHGAVDHDPVQDISHLALGNVYAALGDYKRSLACYENVLSLNPENTRALQLKHALLCHKKLESELLNMHSSLQDILKDLQKQNEINEEWLDLQNRINWERNNIVKEFFPFSQPIYLNLQMLLQHVELQAKNLNEEVSRKVPQQRSREISSGEKIFRSKNSKKCEERKNSRSSTNELLKKGSENKKERDDTKPGSEHSLSNKVNSLLTFIRSNYEEEIKFINFKRNIDKDFQMNNKKNHFAINGDFSLDNIEACVKDSTDVKKLN